MRRVADIVLVVFTLLLARPSLGAPGDEASASTPVLTSPRVLSANAPRWTTYLPVGPRALRSTAPVLQLDLTPSPTLDLEKSRLTVAWDEQPLGTWTVQELVESDGLIRLGDPDAGYHALSFDADLFVRDDSCREDRRAEAWLRLDKELEVVWSAGDEEAPTVPDLLADWVARGVATIQVPDPLSPEMAVAYFHAVEFLARRNVRVTEDAEVELRLEVDEASELVSVSTDKRALLVRAGSASALSLALHDMASDDFLPSCPGRTCHLRPLDEKESIEVSPKSQGRDEGLVSLAEQLKGGGALLGDGEHRLRFAWKRPVDWEVHSGARVHLLVKKPRETEPQGSEVALSLELNGVLLDRWQLTNEPETNGRAVELAVTIPDRMLGADLWDFALTAQLNSREEEACVGRREVGPALFIDPKSSLFVPHDRTEGDAIADWALSLVQRPLLRFTAPPTKEAVQVLSSLLQPVSERFPGAPWRLATSVDPESSASHQPEVLVGRVPAEGSRFEVLSHGGRSYIAPRTGEVKTALIPDSEALILERLGADLGVILGAAPRRLLPGGAPLVDLAQLGAPIALLSEQGWTSVGSRLILSRKSVQTRVPPKDNPSIISEKATKYVLTNIIWVLLTGMFLGALLHFFRKQAPES